LISKKKKSNEEKRKEAKKINQQTKNYIASSIEVLVVKLTALL
jgi:hypothetical protein